FKVDIQDDESTFDFSPLQEEWNCFHVQRKNDTLFVYENSELIGVSQVSSDPLQIATGGIIIGQEQDCIGGCFQANQSLAGSLDNFKITNCPMPIPKDEKCNYPTGISSLFPPESSIYPMPADNEIFIQANANTTEFICTDAIGQTINLETAPSSDGIIIANTRRLVSGIYYLIFYQRSSAPLVKKVVIAH
ncbi:MAG: hypothetical protein ACHQD9_07285, partial [Chitinophagales bacterium]